MKRQLTTTLLACTAMAMQTNAQEFLHVGEYDIPVSNVTKITVTHQEHPQSLSLMLEQDENATIFAEAWKPQAG